MKSLVEQAVEYRNKELDRERELALERDKLELRQNVANRTNSPASNRLLVWTGTLRELGDLSNGMYKKKWIKATSSSNALQQVCSHFVKPDGTPIDPHSVRQNIRNRNKEKKKKP